MKIIGFGICGPGEADRYMEATLKEFKRLCDETVICLNNATQKEKDLLDKYQIPYIEDNREWGKVQWKIKQDFYINHILPRNPDWVLPMDLDEVFESSFTRKELEELCDKGGAGFYFYVAQLYDEGYSRDWSFWNIRLFNAKIDPQWQISNVHPGLAPKQAYFQGNYAPFILKHYGLKKIEDRDRRVARYKKYDPDGVFKSKNYYDFLASNIEADVYDEEALHKEVYDFVHKLPIKDIKDMRNRQKKWVYIRRLSDDFTFEIEESKAQETINRGGFAYVGKAVTPNDIRPQETEESNEPKGPVCDICGKTFKNGNGLRLHSRVHQ